MRDLDPMIDAALAAEERDLLRRIGDDEAGHFQQLADVFSGRNGWIGVLMMSAQALLFIAGVWAGWRFFHAADVLAALHWGLPAATLLIMSLMVKLAMWPQMQTHRLLLALKRVELRIAAASQD